MSAWNFMPCSSAVGTLGNAGSRCDASTPRTFRLPARTSGVSAPGSWTTASMCPPIRLVTTWAAPNGMWLTSTCCSLKKPTPVMWVWLPIPELPTRNAPGLLPGVVHQVLQAVPGRIGLHRQHRQLHRHPRHRVEGGVVEVRQAGIVDRRDRVGVEDHRVAVGLLPLHVLVADGAAGARPVDHRHRLSQLPGHAVGEDAGDHIGGRAGGEQHGELYRLGGIVLRRRLQRPEGHERQRPRPDPSRKTDAGCQ